MSNFFSDIFNAIKKPVEGMTAPVRDIVKGDFGKIGKDIKHIPGSFEGGAQDTMHAMGIGGWVGKHPLEAGAGALGAAMAAPEIAAAASSAGGAGGATSAGSEAGGSSFFGQGGSLQNFGGILQKIGGLQQGQQEQPQSATPVMSPYSTKMHINMKRFQNPATAALMNNTQINETDLGSQFENNSSSY